MLFVFGYLVCVVRCILFVEICWLGCVACCVLAVAYGMVVVWSCLLFVACCVLLNSC